jgi:2-dehydro-3-deoxyphosphooctonate aldolase (KDO 8-P synthase)
MSITNLKSLFKEQYNPENFFLIAGPCVVEDEALLFHVAEKVSAICKRLNIPYIFKASYRKANRTSINSFSGVGDVEGLDLLQKTGQAFNLPVTSDITLRQKLRWQLRMWIYCRSLHFCADKQTCCWQQVKPANS